MNVSAAARSPAIAHAATVPRLRCSEWLIIFHFLYAGVIALVFHLGFKALLLAGFVAAAVWLIARWVSLLRNLAPLAFILTAYREMDWFTPATSNYRLESIWIGWDRRLLDGWHLRAAIESWGAWLPFLLEASYTSLYIIIPLALLLLYKFDRTAAIDRFWTAVLAGTLLSYELFPYFPSVPPRNAFPGSDLPSLITAPRELNLWLTGNFGIHSSVFPSAHVSTALACAWAIMCLVPTRRAVAWGLAALGFSIGIAAVFGRYHYAVDVAAGIVVSLIAFPAIRLASRFGERD